MLWIISNLAVRGRKWICFSLVVLFLFQWNNNGNSNINTLIVRRILYTLFELENKITHTFYFIINGNISNIILLNQHDKRLYFDIILYVSMIDVLIQIYFFDSQRVNEQHTTWILLVRGKIFFVRFNKRRKPSILFIVIHSL